MRKDNLPMQNVFTMLCHLQGEDCIEEKSVWCVIVVFALIKHLNLKKR